MATKQKTTRRGGEAQVGKPEEKKEIVAQAVIPDGIDIAGAAQLAGNEHIEMQDQALPWLKVAQLLTPELEDDEFDGLAFGDLFLPSGEIWKAKEGLVYVPFYYGRTYVEWIARNAGGGFVEDHGLQKGKELAKTCKRAENKKVPTILESGNELIETAYWAGFIVDPEDGSVEQAIFAMTSSFLSVSKGWNTKIMKYRIGGAQNYIRFARPWHVTSERKEDGTQRWATPKIKLYKPKDHEDVFHTYHLPNGIELWQECARLAGEFKETFRLQASEGQTMDADPVDNEAVPEGDQPY